MPGQRPGTIVTFLADRNGPEVAPVVADVAWVLASAGRRVLLLDWDFERPALHLHLRPFLADAGLAVTDGILDFALECARLTTEIGQATEDDATHHVVWPNILRYAVALEWSFEGGGELDLLPAGRQDEGYEARAEAFDWETFYRHRGGVAIVQEARARMRGEYDLVLVAGRPVGDDPAGLTSRRLPDRLVPLLSLDERTLDRTAEMLDEVLRLPRAIDLRPVPVAGAGHSAPRRRRDWRPVEERFDRYLEPMPPADRRAWWREVAFPERRVLPGHRQVLAAVIDPPDAPDTTLAAATRLAGRLVDGGLGAVAPLSEVDRRRLLAIYAVPDRPADDDAVSATATVTAAPAVTVAAPAPEIATPPPDRRAGWWIALAVLLGTAAAFLLFQDRSPRGERGAGPSASPAHRLATRSEEIRVEPRHDPQLSLLLAVEALRAAGDGPAAAPIQAIERAMAAIPAPRPQHLGTTPALGQPVSEVDFSHDGRTLAVHYDSPQFADRRVAIYRAELPLDRHGQGVAEAAAEGLELVQRLATEGALALSGDHRWFATADLDGNLLLTPTVLAGLGGDSRVVGGLDPPVVALALDVDGRRLAAAGFAGAISLADIDGGDAVRLSWEGTERLRFGPRGATLIAAGGGGARLWSLARRREVEPGAGIRDPGDAPTALAFSTDGRFLSTGRADGSVRVWLLPDGDRLARADHALPVDGLSLSADGGLVAAAGSGRLGVWSTEDGASLDLLGDGAVVASAFYPFGTYLLTASGAGDAAIWEPRSGRRISRLARAEPLTSVAVDLSGALAATATASGAVHLWRLHGGPEAVAVRPQGRPVFAQLDAAGERIVVASADGDASVWSAADGAPLAEMATGATGLQAAIWSPDGGQVAAATLPEGRVWLWRPGGTAPPRVLPGNDHRLSAGAFSPDGERFVSGSPYGVARIWRTAGDALPVLLRGHTGQVWSAAFSPDGRRVVTAAADHTARVHAADGTGEPLVLAGHEGPVWSAAFSPDGRRLVTASADGTARVWSLDGATSPRLLRGHRGNVWSAAFSPDGEHVVTASSDGSVRLWPLAGDDDEARVLGVHGDQAVSAAFGPEGRRVVSASADGTVRVWLCRSEDLADLACDRLTRNLSREEWRREIGDRPYARTCPELPAGD